MLPKILALGLLCLSFNAFANSDQKPDEFAHTHWSAKAAPITSPATPTESKIALPVTSQAPSMPAAEIIEPTPNTKEFPRVALCRIVNRPKPGKRQSRLIKQFLISDSDGVDACDQLGGEIVAGHEEDRSLGNVKKLLRH
jgi:hypothetical protein